jgi:hypothetical protein
MKVGDRRYRIAWSKGQPSVQVGRVVISAAPKRLSWRVQWPDGKAAKFKGSATMREAIKEDISMAANLFGVGYFRRKKAEPMELAHRIVELMRLLRKLERHHLA